MVHSSRPRERAWPRIIGMAAPLDAMSWVTIRPLDWPWLQPIRRHHFAAGLVVYAVLWVGSAFDIGKPVAIIVSHRSRRTATSPPSSRSWAWRSSGSPNDRMLLDRRL